MKFQSLIAAAFFVAVTSSSIAAPYISTTPLDGIAPITFDEVPLNVGDVVNNQFSAFGITFLDTAYFDSTNTLLGGVGYSSGAINGSHIGNWIGINVLYGYPWPPLSLIFNRPVNEAVVGFLQGGSTPGEVTVNALLNGSVVESFSNSSLIFGATSYVGFTNIVFDELQITNSGLHDVVIDNVQFSSVPVPSAAWLFGSGLVGLIRSVRKYKVA